MRNLSEVGTRFFKASSPKSNNWSVLHTHRISQRKKEKVQTQFFIRKRLNIQSYNKEYYTRGSLASRYKKNVKVGHPLVPDD